MSPTTVLPSLLLVFALGCASPAGPRDPAGWLEARGADLMDVFGVRVGFGPGLGVYVRATQYAQLGFLVIGPSEQTLPRPEDVNVRSLPCFMFGTIGRYGGAWFESHTEFMLPGWSTRDDDPLRIQREVIVGYVPPYGQEDQWRWAVGAGAYLILAGVEAEIRPYELWDFIGGLVGYDPSSDDVPVASPDSPDEADVASDS